MNRDDIVRFFAALDEGLTEPSVLYVYGSAVIILLGSPFRTSLDIDVAGPYSSVDEAALARAGEKAGLPVNPDSDYLGNHIEWVGPLRLCLPLPDDDGLTLWQGKRLVVKSANIPALVASKLIRYDETDRGDVQFLYSQFPFDWESVCRAAKKLPPPFAGDILVRDNLEALANDLQLWRGTLEERQ